jgi:hypothetical protein
MQDTFTIDARKFNKALDTVAIVTRKGAPAVVKEQARLLLQRAQTGFTPPETLAEGRAKIAKDIYGKRDNSGLFQVFKPELIENPIEGNFVTLFASKDTKRAYGVKRVMFWPGATMGKMREWHRSRYKTGSDGRIKVKSPAPWIASRFVDFNKPAVEKPVLDRYVRMMQSRVGRLKAGWNKALKAVGGKIPKWVAKHQEVESNYGICINELLKKDFPSITIGNQAPTIGRWRTSWESLLNSRANDMVKRANHLLKKAKKAGKF